MQQHNLAIVIPAYKESFLREAIKSFSLQTNKDFTLYIGDDCSPYDLAPIVNDFRDNINIVYRRFSTNWGKDNLTAQWSRCIDMTEGEDWIWLFSDDDLVDKTCVESFYNEVNRITDDLFDIYHFNIKVINETGTIIDEPWEFPTILKANNFFEYKSKLRLKSYAVEYIFSRRVFEEKGGFQNFDLAWGSDDATWIKFGLQKGIKTINSSMVYWRSSRENITPSFDSNLSLRKINSVISYLLWVEFFFEVNNIRLNKFVYQIGFLNLFKRPSTHVSLVHVFKKVIRYNRKQPFFAFGNLIYLMLYRCYKSIF